MIKSPIDPTDDAAIGPSQTIAPTKTATSYSEPGLPSPPAGWGKVIGYDEVQMERDEQERQPDTDEANT